MSDVAGFLQSFLADRADVHVLDGSVSQFLGIVKRGQPVEAVVGDFGDSSVGFARISVCRREMRFGENSEQRCFAYLRQANDASFHKEASSC